MKRVKFDDGWLMEGDCLRHMAAMRPKSVDLVFGSPPYEDQRTYGIGFRLKGQDWVDWMVEVVKAALRVCRGLVAFVVGHGQQRKYKWSATPALLLADLHRAGVCLRSPKWYHRVGIPGSGGPDDLRKDVEWVVCATNGRRLPWADPLACGKPWKYKVGGGFSYYERDGQRVNRKVKKSTTVSGKGDPRTKSVERTFKDDANPGDVIKCTVGGGKMGSMIAHENEAPFPLELPEFFVQTFCPPGGRVYDPFGGSGTTVHAAIKHGRTWLASDLRPSQIDLMKRRIRQARASGKLFRTLGTTH